MLLGVIALVLWTSLGAAVAGSDEHDMDHDVHDHGDVKNVTGTHFKVVTIVSSPFVYTQPDENCEEPRVQGFLVDIMEQLKKRLGFTYNLYIVPDGSYGFKDTEGVWHGMIGELVNEKADIVFAPLTVTLERARVVHFGAPFMEAGIVPIIQKPKDGGALPFQSTYEMAIGGKYRYGSVTGGSTLAFFKDNKYSLYKQMGEYMTSNPSNLMTTTWDGIKETRKGDYAFLGDEPFLRWYEGQKPCDLTVIGKPINDPGYAMAFRKGDKGVMLAEMFNHGMMDLKEDGTFAAYENMYWNNVCPKPKLCFDDEEKAEENNDDPAPVAAAEETAKAADDAATAGEEAAETV